jgi:endonuclease/exonuclease/phosphatase (EEP) superfamily protein YafD
VHLPRPGDGVATAERNDGLSAMPPAIAGLPPLRLVIGDCNATRWCATFAEMQAAAGLRDSSDGMGWQGTWPTMLPGWLRIPIDQVLVGGGIGVRDRRVGMDIGSDHMPVIADLDLPTR